MVSLRAALLLAVVGCGCAVRVGSTEPAAAPVTVRVDVSRGRHRIDPRIYGVAFASKEALADLNAPLNRSGGNELSCSTRASFSAFVSWPLRRRSFLPPVTDPARCSSIIFTLTSALPLLAN